MLFVKKLLEDGSIYAVIGMPANLFFGTSIPTTVIILKKKIVTIEMFYLLMQVKNLQKGKKPKIN
ncbi:N-6 DNA methylase [Enterococcus faecalis]|uniref:N-6 DNA methylase n=1 Tax=Enterococcus faecalis TaxID=1351 RepID=A0A974S6J2_ENTFL|nr:N-6 DNA methylase [Enterococcus faecalis]